MSTVQADRVLVTGSSGFIGQALVRRLVGQSAAVAGLCRHSEPVVGMTPIRLDLNDAEAVIDAVGHFAPTLCYHLAAHPDATECHDQSQTVLQTNIMGTLNLVEALRLSGGCRLVYGCSVKVYGNGPVPYRPDQAVTPNSSYGVAKAAGAELIQLYRRLYGLPVVILRPTLVYGPGQRHNLFSFAAGRLAAGAEDIPLMGGSQTRAPVYIDDAVDAFVAAGAALAAGNAVDGATIPISGEEELTTSDLVLEMARVARRRLTPVLIEAATRPTEIFRCIGDNSAAAELIGWHPSTPLAEGFRRTLEHAGLTVPTAQPAAPIAQAQ